MANVCIIGAGISGLTIAYRLQSSARVTLLESRNRLGGAIQTGRVDGYLLEHGPNSVLTTQAFYRLIQELGLESELVTAKPQLPRYIAKKDAGGRMSLTALPRTPLSVCRSKLISWAAKIRVLADPFVGRCNEDDESIYDFFCRHLGAEFAEYLVAPVISGIWATNARQLSARSCMAAAWKSEERYRSLLLALLVKQVSVWVKPPSTPGATVSFTNGLEALAQRLGERLHLTDIITSAEVSCETPRQHDRTFVTTDAIHCGNLLERDFPGFAAAVQKVPYAPVGVIHLGVRRNRVRHSLDGFGFLVPPIYNRTLRAAIFSSSLFPHRAPPDCHLLTCFLNGDPWLDEVQEQLFAELDELLGLGEVPVVLHTAYLPAAIPNYPVGHHALQAEVGLFHASQDKIRIVASWYKGVSVAQRVEESSVAANQLLD